MHLIFIRHGDPDYANNTVTEKGKVESQLLSERVAQWKVTDFFCSPYGRAQDTIKPALARMGRTMETMDWLKEFDHKVKDPSSGRVKGCSWDWMPHDFWGNKELLDRKCWTEFSPLKDANIATYYGQVCQGMDSLLERYGYSRTEADSAIYRCQPHLTVEEASVDTHLLASQKNLDERNLVFVCHLGVMFAIISHLTGISPVCLWQGFFVAPTSVTVLGAEERSPGEVVFRVQTMGDTSHLKAGGENASASGFFGNFTDF